MFVYLCIKDREISKYLYTHRVNILSNLYFSRPFDEYKYIIWSDIGKSERSSWDPHNRCQPFCNNIVYNAFARHLYSYIHYTHSRRRFGRYRRLYFSFLRTNKSIIVSVCPLVNLVLQQFAIPVWIRYTICANVYHCGSLTTRALFFFFFLLSIIIGEKKL